MPEHDAAARPEHEAADAGGDSAAEAPVAQRDASEEDECDNELLAKSSESQPQGGHSVR